MTDDEREDAEIQRASAEVLAAIGNMKLAMFVDEDRNAPTPPGTLMPKRIEQHINWRLQLAGSEVRVQCELDRVNVGKVLVRKILPPHRLGVIVRAMEETTP